MQTNYKQRLHPYMFSRLVPNLTQTSVENRRQKLIGVVHLTQVIQ